MASENRMKVLIFMTQFYRLCGAERLAVELAEELNRRGIRADILSMYREDLPGVAEARLELQERGIPNIHFLGLDIHPPVSSLLPAVLKLKGLLRKHQYDIIETSMLSPTVIAAWAARGGSICHITGVHAVFRRDRENSRQHKFLRFSVCCNRRIRYYAVSDSARDAWIRYANIPARFVRKIYNSIHEDFFSARPDRDGIRDELGIPRTGKIVLQVGRIARRKGCNVTLEALLPYLQQDDLYLLYVGQLDPLVPGSAEMLDKMKRLIINAGLEEKVRFLGYRTDIPRLMASSDLLVHPAEIEAFGLILVEAMATGLPVVASNVDGIPEVLSGTDSPMIDPGDVRGLRQAVLSVFGRTRTQALEAARKGRQRAKDFRTSARIDKMLNLFNATLAGWF